MEHSCRRRNFMIAKDKIRRRKMRIRMSLMQNIFNDSDQEDNEELDTIYCLLPACRSIVGFVVIEA